MEGAVNWVSVLVLRASEHLIPTLQGRLESAKGSACPHLAQGRRRCPRMKDKTTCYTLQTSVVMNNSYNTSYLCLDESRNACNPPM